MSERREFETSAEDLDRLIKAVEPTVMMWGSGWLLPVPAGTPQENANAAWDDLGRRMGFRSRTARPIPGEGPRFFTAEVAEP